MKKAAKLLCEDIARMIFKILGCMIPVKKNRILFYSFTGTQYSCSPKYISEYLNENFHGNFEIIWAFRNAPEHGPSYAKTVKYQSIPFFYYHLSSKFIVSNIYPYHLIGTKKNQIMLDTWHGGGAYKVAGFDFANGDQKSLEKRIGFYQKNITAFISSSDAFTKYFIRGGMRFNGKVIAAGLPRNDIFFLTESKKESIREKVYRDLGIEEKYRLLLYAPTWRSEEDNEGFVLDTDRLKSALKNRFGGEWKILIRMHMYTSTVISGDVVDAQKYPDMQELLLASDVLVSDYSSSIWDYSLTAKPCFLYTYDLDKYQSERSFYIDISKWGFPICKNFEELLFAIEHFDKVDFEKKMKKHFEMLGGYDCGEACRIVSEYIVKASE